MNAHVGVNNLLNDNLRLKTSFWREGLLIVTELLLYKIRFEILLFVFVSLLDRDWLERIVQKWTE